MAKTKDINKNLAKLKGNIDKIDKSKQPVAMEILSRIEFMRDTLISLEEIIKQDGAIIKTINGNGFETILEHPAQKSYNVMISRYNAALKTLLDMLDASPDDSDELLDFLKR